MTYRFSVTPNRLVAYFRISPGYALADTHYSHADLDYFLLNWI